MRFVGKFLKKQRLRCLLPKKSFFLLVVPYLCCAKYDKNDGGNSGVDAAAMQMSKLLLSANFYHLRRVDRHQFRSFF